MVLRVLVLVGSLLGLDMFPPVVTSRRKFLDQLPARELKQQDFATFCRRRGRNCAACPVAVSCFTPQEILQEVGRIVWACEDGFWRASQACTTWLEKAEGPTSLDVSELRRTPQLAANSPIWDPNETFS